MKLKDKKEILINCPFCGAEYLPAEIFIPSNFFGKPTDIDKSTMGKLEVYEGSSMNLTENFTCDFCGKEFEVDADIKFKSKDVESNSFEEVYTTPLYPNKISLFEGDENDTD